MRKVRGSKPDVVQDKKTKNKKQNSVSSLGNMEEKKRGENEVGKKRIGEKTARDVTLGSA